MTNTVPSQTPGAPRAAKSQAGSAPGMPSAEPPAKASAHADCGCGGARWRWRRPGFRPRAGGTLRRCARRRGRWRVAATSHSDVHVAGLWSINEDRNCWIYIDTVGWRKLSTTSESGLVALNMLAANAYQQNAVASCYEGDDGQISQIYVWSRGGRRCRPGRHRHGGGDARDPHPDPARQWPRDRRGGRLHLVVSLPETPSTGFRWVVEAQGGLRPAGDRFDPGGGAPGAAGVRRFTWQAGPRALAPRACVPGPGTRPEATPTASGSA